jgi:hypothetical protein
LQRETQSLAPAAGDRIAGRLSMGVGDVQGSVYGIGNLARGTITSVSIAGLQALPKSGGCGSGPGAFGVCGGSNPCRLAVDFAGSVPEPAS